MKKALTAGLAAFTLMATGSALAQEERGADMRGLGVMVGGGVEGYTNALAPQIDTGVTYGATVALKPTRVVGLELGYTGALHNLEEGDRGADLVRNGAHALATIGLTATQVQPYVMGGLGFSSYHLRGDVEGFADDTVGNIPVGAGLRTHFGSFTADARLNYNILFDQEFARRVPVIDADTPDDTNFSAGGRYTGTLNFGLMW